MIGENLAQKGLFPHSMPYLIREIELTGPVPGIVLPRDRDGLALVIRCEDVPVGFVMRPLMPGSCLSPEQVRKLAAENAAGGPRRVPGPPADLTVAVCTHARHEVLSRCLAALTARRETWPYAFEILVIDNAPPDGRVRQVVESLGGVRYVEEPRPGLNFARNRALREASNPILAFVDDDAVIDRAWLAGLSAACAENPGAGVFTGPVLPLELETPAQILFEARGGFGRSFEKAVFGPAVRRPFYPCVGLPGVGCNMAFRREALLALGGFDEALDAAPPFTSGGDLDALYRVVRAGHSLAYEPSMLLYHEHRREYAKLRHQVRSWGWGFIAYLAKSYRWDKRHRAAIRQTVYWWFAKRVKRVVQSLLRIAPYPLPTGLAWAEVMGGVEALFGGYAKSLRRANEIRRRYS